jgi:hypothetical protein
LSPPLGVAPTPYPDHVATFPSPIGSIPGVPSSVEPNTDATIKPISWFPAVFVNDETLVLMFPLNCGLIPARYVNGYAIPPTPTVELTVIAVEYVWSAGLLMISLCSVPFASGSPDITMSNANPPSELPGFPPITRACTAKSSTWSIPALVTTVCPVRSTIWNCTVGGFPARARSALIPNPTPQHAARTRAEFNDIFMDDLRG